MTYRLLLIFIILFIPQRYPLKNGRPTPEGIDMYIKENQQNFIDEYQEFVKDTIINDIFFSSQDFKKLNKNIHIFGYNNIYQNSCEIVINNTAIYRGYSIPSDIENYNEYDYFVKAVIFHEMTHFYFFQCILVMQAKNIQVNSFYRNIQLVSNPELLYGAQFIEEGVCEYVIHKKKEVAQYKTIFIPSYEIDINDKFNIKYKYAYFFVRDFLDGVGIKYGIMILLANKPPSYEEILDRDLFVNRLKYE